MILVDKGYCGSSGATASAGTSLWFASDTQQQAQAIHGKEAMGGYLSDRRWQQRVLDHTCWNTTRLAEFGYPFPLDSRGQPYRAGLQGPEYMRLMRSLIKRAGVRILDHSPALGLLTDNDNDSVSGAYGVRMQKNCGWEICTARVILVCLRHGFFIYCLLPRSM